MAASYSLSSIDIVVYFIQAPLLISFTLYKFAPKLKHYKSNIDKFNI